VCGFKIEDIRKVFSGDYRTFNPDKHHWSTSGTRRNVQGQVGPTNQTLNPFRTNQSDPEPL
jgi:hypothetical protein